MGWNVFAGLDGSSILSALRPLSIGESCSSMSRGRYSDFALLGPLLSDRMTLLLGGNWTLRFGSVLLYIELSNLGADILADVVPHVKHWHWDKCPMCILLQCILCSFPSPEL